MSHDIENLLQILTQFDTAMLVTHDPDGLLRARPLSIAECEKDGTLWFLTARDSGKVFEIEDDARVNVVLQGKRRYVSISGVARLVEDRDRIRELWRESFRPWFPGGENDPSAVAVRVDPITAEYWDNTGLAGLSYALHALRATVKGERASDEPSAGYHGRVGTDDKSSAGLERRRGTKPAESSW